MWTSRGPSFDYFHGWGCKAEAKFYNPNEKKLDSRTTSCFFIGYSEKSKGFKFYCLEAHTRVQETHNAMFLEDEDVSELVRDIFVFEEIKQSIESASQMDYKYVPILTRLPASNLDSDQEMDDTMVAQETQEMAEQSNTEGIQIQDQHAQVTDQLFV